MPHKKFTHSKKTKGSRYQGVYRIKNGWQVMIIINKVRNIFGPFPTEADAAKYYDKIALDNFGENTRLNFTTILPQNSNKNNMYNNNNNNNNNDEVNDETENEDVDIISYKDSNNLIKKIHKNKTNIKKREGMIGKTIHKRKGVRLQVEKRKQFPSATRNKICSLQKWRCNFCKELFADTFIIDHIVPLFLGGTNAEHNLQAICNSCDRFKTSYLDYKVLMPIVKYKQLAPKDVIELQNQNFHKMKCTNPEDSQHNLNYMTVEHANNINLSNISGAHQPQYHNNHNQNMNDNNNNNKRIELVIHLK